MAKRRARELTDEDVAALPRVREGERKHIMDTDCRGLLIRVGHKTRTYNLQMRDRDGKPLRRLIGNCSDMTLAKARETANEWRAVVKGGLDPKEEAARQRRAALAELTNSFEAVARLFVTRYLAPKNRSWKEQARELGLVPDPKKPDDLKKFQAVKGGLVEKWGDRKIHEIRRADINAVLDEIIDRGSPVMANRVLALLHKLFKWAIGRDFIEVSPCAGVERPRPEKSRDRVLTDAELVRVWRAADDIGYPFGTIVKLLALTGQRKSEVAGLKWGELDLPNKTWKLSGERTKNKLAHEVPLSDAALVVIEGVPRVKGCDFLFSTTGDSAVSGFSKFKTALDGEAKISDWHLHDLRRSCVSGMAALGINLPVIEKVVNHVSGSFAGIVQVYQRHSFADEKRVALQAWGRHVEALVSGKSAPTGVTNLAAVRARKASR